MKGFNVHIGFDPRQPVAFSVASQSVWRNATGSINIGNLKLSSLPIKRRGLTDFTYSRFLVPYLNDYEGYSLFMDSDMLCRGDVYELLAYAVAYPDCDVFVVKNPVHKYEWPSLMLFNNERCAALTPSYIDDVNNSLFDFAWARSVGTLPAAWNHLVGYDQPNPNAKMVHYTKGIPIWAETQSCEFANEWREEFKRTCASVSFQELMGKSRHVTQQ